MDVPLLDLRAQYRAIREEIDRAITGVVESQAFVLGPVVEEFENAVAKYLGVPHAVSCASGTDALLLVLKALDLQPGDEVIVPSFTFFATAGAVWNAGLRPVFCDVDPHTFNVTPGTLDACWTDRTRVMIPVHLFGQMAPMPEIGALATERGAFVLEDAAQAIGSRQESPDASGGGGPAGVLGDAGAFSFFPTKNLGAFGEGGLVTTRSDELAARVAKLRVHGGRQMYHHELVGTNSRLDALQAAVLRAKLPHLDAWADARRGNALRYDELLDDMPEVRTPHVAPGNLHVYNQYTIRVQRRDELRDFLAERGIGTGVYYPVPLHLQPCFASLGYRHGDLPVSEALCQDVLSLPVFPELGAERQDGVVSAIRDFFRRG